MNDHINAQVLPYKTKDELKAYLQEEMTKLNEAEDDEYTEEVCFSNIEQIIYVLRNVEYEGREA